MKIKNKNFPSNDCYFGEPTEHLYLHQMQYTLESDGNGIMTFSFFSKSNTDFTNMVDDDNIKNEFIKIVNSYDGGIPASGKLYENYIPLKIIGFDNINKAFQVLYSVSNDYGTNIYSINMLEYFEDYVIQIY